MGPAVAIPVGLFTIGLGFFLMKLGSIASHPSALTMLPGCALAGAGLGLTNTPVTNTTTGAVSADRAGMASGIDMTTRMLTLAINISLMGAILTTGILSELRALLPAAVAEPVLRPLVENIVAGNVDALRAGMPALDSWDRRRRSCVRLSIVASGGRCFMGESVHGSLRRLAFDFP